jgi:hypothetical protein
MRAKKISGQMMKYGFIIFLLTLAFSVHAQKMYKSVDEAGNVSYSSTPKPEAAMVEKVASPPAVSEEQKQHSQQQQDNIREKSESLGQERQQRAL